MSLSQTLLNKASELRQGSEEYVAVAMLKQAGFDEATARAEVAQALMEKEAASHLQASGIDYDEALAMVKTSGVKISDMGAFKAEKTSEEVLADLLEKSAQEVAELEKAASEVPALLEKIAQLQEALAEVPEIQEVPEPITKMAQSGDFTQADLQALMALPSDVLTKVASSQATQPWRMGKAGSQSSGSGDPLLDFLIS